jgi:sulfatase maturation enzyme AslB (radical SAM superfamily)
MIRCINFSLSNRCNANCIWCPTSRGTKHNFDLPIGVVKKVVDEFADPACPHKLEMIHISENGEALYNPDFLDIIRYVKEKLPDISINFLSNFGLLTKDISEALFKEKLLTSVQVNIDGHDKESYEAVKGISYKSVIKNLKYFLEMREKYDPDFDFCINVMPAFEYTLTVKQYFGTTPDRYDPTKPTPFSTFSETKKSLREFVPKNVRIRYSKSGLWSERRLITSGKVKSPVDQSKLDCPLLDRVEHEVFIAPNGDWYACCLDDNNDIVLGNVKDNTVHELFLSQKRLTFLDRLKNRKFDEIGYPCNTVVCCQTISLHPEDFQNMTKGLTPGMGVKF